MAYGQKASSCDPLSLLNIQNLENHDLIIDPLRFNCEGQSKSGGPGGRAPWWGSRAKPPEADAF